MSALLIAEHNNKEVKPFTLNAITAASQIDQDLHVLVIGNKCDEVAKSISQIPNVKKVIHVDNEAYENFLAENYTSVIVKHAENYSHIICSANTFGKNLMPRIAAALDTSQISDIIQTLELNNETERNILKSRFLAEVLMYENRKNHTKKYYNGFRFIVTIGSILLHAILSMGQMDPAKLPKHFESISYWASWGISLTVTASHQLLLLALEYSQAHLKDVRTKYSVPWKNIIVYEYFKFLNCFVNFQSISSISSIKSNRFV